MVANKIPLNYFQLTDVEQGGATVFPNIRKAVFPQRGSVVMWYNLKDNGQIDTQTLHAACPVIVGSKWGMFAILQTITCDLYFLFTPL